MLPLKEEVEEDNEDKGECFPTALLSQKASLHLNFSLNHLLIVPSLIISRSVLMSTYLI